MAISSPQLLNQIRTGVLRSADRERTIMMQRTWVLSPEHRLPESRKLPSIGWMWSVPMRDSSSWHEHCSPCYQFRKWKSQVTNTKEKPYVVDNPRSFTRALVDRLSWAHRWRTNSLAARSCPRGAGYQSGVWPESYLKLNRCLMDRTSLPSLRRRLCAGGIWRTEPVEGKDRFQRSPGGNAGALSTASSASSQNRGSVA